MGFLATLSLVAALASVPETERSNPCRGADLVFDKVSKRCAVSDACRPAPSAKDLTITVGPATVASGGRTEVEVVLANATAAPLTFDLENARGFEAAIVGPDGKPVSRFDDCGGGIVGVLGGSDHKPTIRVTLVAGGRLRARVPVEAVVRRTVGAQRSAGGAGFAGLIRCKEKRGPAVPPGRYRLSISLPLFDENPQNPGTGLGRTTATDVTVGPARQR